MKTIKSYKSIIVFMFTAINFMLIIVSASQLKNTQLFLTMFSAIVALINLALVLSKRGTRYWLLIALISYYRHVYYYILSAYYNSINFVENPTLPYIFATNGSYNYAAFLMFLEQLTIMFAFIIYFKRNNTNESKGVKFQIKKDKNTTFKLLLLSILFCLTINSEHTVINYINNIITILFFMQAMLSIKGARIAKYIKFIGVVFVFMVVIIHIMSTNRKRIIYFGVASYFFLLRLFPDLKKAIRLSLFLISIFLVAILTMNRFSGTSLMNYVTNSNSITSYFLTIDRVAIGVETVDYIPNNLFIQLLFDIFRPIVGLGFILKSSKYRPSVDYFNERISFGGNTRSDQILPFNTQVSFISPIFLILVIFLLLNYFDKANKNLLKVSDARYTFLVAYALTVVSFFQVTNLTIIFNTLSYTVFPIYFIILFESYFNRWRR